jgi:hypothetical protein
VTPRVKRSWIFLAAAAIPCVLLLAFCSFWVHEWWLISTHQIVMIPTPKRGQTWASEMPASDLVPVILGSGALAALFGYALFRGSKRVLGCAYLILGLIMVAPLVKRML